MVQIFVVVETRITPEKICRSLVCCRQFCYKNHGIKSAQEILLPFEC